MHRGHDHFDQHHGGVAGRTEPGPGHNHAPPRPTLQWQTPHLEPSDNPHQEHGETDLDLVEAAFVEGFATATDSTSFLRLARVPFEVSRPGEGRLVLLRVEVDAVSDVGSVTPHLGGDAFRYDPLPAKLTSRRRRLRFVYFDGRTLHPLSLTEVRGLEEA